MAAVPLLRRGLLAPALCLVAAGAAASDSADWLLVVPPAQPLRLQRAFEERTPDASARGPLQVQQGVNPWAALALYVATHVIANAVERQKKADAEELVVATDQAAGAAVAAGSVDAQRRYETQEDANRAIRPYAEALAGLSLHELLAAAEPALRARGFRLAHEAPAAADGQRLVHVAPKFVFASDQRSVHVDAVIGFGPLAPDAPARQAMRVQVHSPADDSFDIGEHWLREGGSALRSGFTSLLLTALETAARVRAGLPEAAAPQQTFRLRLAAESVYVRGTLAQADCERALIRALQGHWVVAPMAALGERAPRPAHCPGG